MAVHATVRCRPPGVPRSAAGFLLPISVGGSLLLLLSGLSLQTLALQSHGLATAAERQRRSEDGLSSAAHDLLGAIHDGHRCLLAIPHHLWQAEDGACPAPATVTGLRELAQPALSYRLVAWSPVESEGRGELVLEQAPTDADPPRQAVFAVALVRPAAGADLQSVGVRGLGLRGVAP